MVAQAQLQSRYMEIHMHGMNREEKKHNLTQRPTKKIANQPPS
jgi:hypothetical protein